MGDAPLFLAIDVGTTGARASAVDLDGQLRHESRRPYPTATPRSGWAEQDPRDWRDAAARALEDLLAEPAIDPGNVQGIGLTGQCPTIAPFDSKREPVGPGLLYRDNRAVEQAAAMRERIGDGVMHQRTGHVATAFHVGPKVLWMRERDPETFAATDCFLQPRDVVLHALTGVTATDETHANSTVLFDLRARTWASDLLDAFDLDSAMFAQVHAPWHTVAPVTAAVAARTGLSAGCPVIIGAADSQCAAFGSGVAAPGAISEMAGASSCLNSVILEPSSDRRITHYSHVVPDCYCTELGVNVTGGALSWAVEQLRLDGFEELEAGAQRTLAALRRSDHSDPRLAAPLFLPYLGDGERDDPTLRAAYIGLSDRHGRDELCYAVLEGLAFAVAETVSVLTAAGSPISELRVGGGGARLPALGQIKAGALDVPVRHLANDSAPIGVALLAAAQVGHAEPAARGLDAHLQRAHRFLPDPDLAGAIGGRFAWFLDVRGSSAVRLAP